MAHKHRKGLASREMKCVYRVALRRICDFDSPPAVFGEAAGLRRAKYSDEWSNLILEGTGEFSKHLEGMHESTFGVYLFFEDDTSASAVISVRPVSKVTVNWRLVLGCDSPNESMPCSQEIQHVHRSLIPKRHCCQGVRSGGSCQ